MEEIRKEIRENDTASGSGLEAIEFLLCFQQAATRIPACKEKEGGKEKQGKADRKPK